MDISSKLPINDRGVNNDKLVLKNYATLHINDLPPEMLVNILKYLPFNELIRAKQLNRHFCDVIENLSDVIGQMDHRLFVSERISSLFFIVRLNQNKDLREMMRMQFPVLRDRRINFDYPSTLAQNLNLKDLLDIYSCSVSSSRTMNQKFENWCNNEFKTIFNRFGSWQRYRGDKCLKTALGVLAGSACLATELSLFALAKKFEIFNSDDIIFGFIDVPKQELSAPMMLVSALPFSFIIANITITGPLMAEEAFRNRLPRKIESWIRPVTTNQNIVSACKVGAIASSIGLYTLNNISYGINREKLIFQSIMSIAMGVIFSATHQRFGLFPAFVAHSFHSTVAIAVKTSNGFDSTLFAITVVAIPVIALTALIAKTKPLFKDFTPLKLD